MLRRVWHGLYARVRASRNAKNIATLGLGSAFSLSIPTLITPILSRLYTPEEYGVWGVFTSYAGILAIAISARYDVAIVRAKNAFEREALTALSLWILLGFSFLVLVLVGLDDLLGVGVLSSLGWLAYFLPLYLVFQGGVQVVHAVCNWCERYRLIGGLDISYAGVQAVVRLFVGGVRGGSFGLVVGPVLGAGFALGLGAYRLGLRIGRLFRLPWRLLRLVATRNYRFPLYDLPSNVLNAAATGLPVILFAHYYGEALTGHLTMGISLLFLPVSFVGSAIGKVYYKNACVMSDADLSGFTLGLLRILTVLGFCANGFVLLLGSVLFPLLLGEKWLEAGAYVEILTLWTYVLLLFSPISSLLLAKNKQRVGLLLNLVLLVGRILAVVFCGELGGDARLSIVLYALVSGVVWIWEGGYCAMLLRMDFRKQAWVVLVGLLLFALLWIVKVCYFL